MALALTVASALMFWRERGENRVLRQTLDFYEKALKTGEAKRNPVCPASGQIKLGKPKTKSIFARGQGKPAPLLPAPYRYPGDVGEMQNGFESPDPAFASKPKRLKNRVLAGFELQEVKIEYAYSPLGLRTKNFELNLSIYSDLYLSYAFAPTRASAGVGIETRF